MWYTGSLFTNITEQNIHSPTNYVNQ
jgi:hypothetical protein